MGDEERKNGGVNVLEARSSPCEDIPASRSAARERSVPANRGFSPAAFAVAKLRFGAVFHPGLAVASAMAIAPVRLEDAALALRAAHPILLEDVVLARSGRRRARILPGSDPAQLAIAGGQATRPREGVAR